MQELVGRLAALDPDASESLKVVTYFDALVDGRASITAMLRGAAILSGCAAGFANAEVVHRVAPSGEPARHSDDRWPRHPVGGGGSVWLERTGALHANDEMILERLALGIAVTLDRSPRGIAERATLTVIDPSAALESRRGAARRLALNAAAPYRVIAEPASEGSSSPRLVVETPAGRIGVSVLPESADAGTASTRRGVGLARIPDALPESWASALTALRLTGPREPLVLADGLGTLLLIAPALDAATQENPDLTQVKTLIASHPRALELLEAVAGAESLRAVAVELGLHHSTVQDRVAEHSRALGFELRTPGGRVRLSLVLSHLRYETNRFA